jgi:hypothetical protein
MGPTASRPALRPSASIFGSSNKNPPGARSSETTGLALRPRAKVNMGNTDARYTLPAAQIDRRSPALTTKTQGHGLSAVPSVAVRSERLWTGHKLTRDVSMAAAEGPVQLYSPRATATTAATSALGAKSKQPDPISGVSRLGEDLRNNASRSILTTLSSPVNSDLEQGDYKPRSGVSPRSPARSSARKARLQSEHDRRLGDAHSKVAETLPRLQATGIALDMDQDEEESLQPFLLPSDEGVEVPDSTERSPVSARETIEDNSAAAEAKRDRKVRLV